MFVEVKPERYRSETRSVRLGGHATSIRLEAAFWSTLEEIAAVQGLSLGRFLSKLHDEILDFEGEVTNFTSLLRCACLTYISEVNQQPGFAQNLAREAARDFQLVESAAPLRKLAAR